MTTLARDTDAIGTRTGDGLHDADRNALLLEQRPLFDVQFDESGIKILGQRDRLERVFQSSASAQDIERLVFWIAERADLIQRDGPGQHARAETSDPETRGFFRSEDDQLDRSHRLEACFLESLDRDQSTEHPDHAVEFSGIGNGVGVRAGGHGGGIGRGSLPTGEHIADSIDTNGKSRVFAQLAQIVASAQVGIGKQHARDHRGLRLRDERQFIDALLQKRGIHLGQTGGHHPKRGARLTSL